MYSLLCNFTVQNGSLNSNLKCLLKNFYFKHLNDASASFIFNTTFSRDGCNIVWNFLFAFFLLQFWSQKKLNQRIDSVFDRGKENRNPAIFLRLYLLCRPLFKFRSYYPLWKETESFKDLHKYVHNQ